MATYFAGTAGDVSFDSVTLKVQTWSFSDEATEIETTNKSSLGFYGVITGKRKGSGSFEALWDNDISYGNPPVIASGNSGTLNLNADADGTPKISGTAFITNCEYTHELDGALKYTASFVMDGDYVLMGES